MDKNAIKRIIKKDIKSIEQQNLNSLGIYVAFNENNITEATAMIIGPEGGLYENGILFFYINFPKNYPYAPPDVSYVPQNRIRIHPNIYVGGHKKGGKVCLSILGTWSGPKWTSIMDISTVLLCIQSLLDTNPLHHEPGHENNNGKMNSIYNNIIEYNTVQSLIVENLQNIPPDFLCFKDDIIRHFHSKKSQILEKIKKWQTKKDVQCSVSFYKINHILKYKETFDKINQMISNL